MNANVIETNALTLQDAREMGVNVLVSHSLISNYISTFPLALMHVGIKWSYPLFAKRLNEKKGIIEKIKNSE